MKTGISGVLIALLQLLPLHNTAQQPESRFRNVEELLETLAGEMEEGEENASWLEELKQLSENRIDVNSAGKEELLRIPFLNELNAGEIIRYRERFGPFFTPYELASVPGIGRDLAERISFFILAAPTEKVSRNDIAFQPRGYHDLLVRSGKSFPLPAGYRRSGKEPPAFQGSPWKTYLRYGFEKGEGIKAGMTADKDPGEPFFRSGNRTGFDFYSAYLSFRISKVIHRVILGDFSARTGQGLIVWQGFSMGKSADATLISKNLSTLSPYTSSDENRYFRGIATTLHAGKGKVNLMFSSKRSDGNLVSGSDSSLYFTSLQTSGYHRTSAEIADKKSIRHTVAGIFYSLTGDHLKTGITALYEHFSNPLIPGDQLYQKFLFNGKENFNLGSDYRWIVGNYQFYGEGAVCKSGGWATIQGVEARLHDQVNLALQFRHFSRNYHSTWANVAARNDKAINETGYYAGIRVFPASGVALSAAADFSRSSWILYTTASPSDALETQVRADLRFSSRLTGVVRYQNRLREGKMKAEPGYLNTTEQKENLRIHTSFQMNKKLCLSGRIELCRFKELATEKGILVFHDAAWTPPRIPLTANIRLSYFNTHSYNTRIYTFENDLLYAFSSLSFSGKGIRTYLNLRWPLFQNTDIWLKIGNTRYFDRETISSGPNKIEGKSKTELKIQFRLKL